MLTSSSGWWCNSSLVVGKRFERFGTKDTYQRRATNAASASLQSRRAVLVLLKGVEMNKNKISSVWNVVFWDCDCVVLLISGRLPPTQKTIHDSREKTEPLSSAKQQILVDLRFIRGEIVWSFGVRSLVRSFVRSTHYFLTRAMAMALVVVVVVVVVLCNFWLLFFYFRLRVITKNTVDGMN